MPSYKILFNRFSSSDDKAIRHNVAPHRNVHQLRYYRPDIDGLRAISIFGVISYHAYPSLMSGGFVGVDVFFVISGFLISTILLSRENNTVSDIKHFISKRVIRLFPAQIVIFIASLLIGWVALFPEEYKLLCREIIDSSFFYLNYDLIGDSGYFDVAIIKKPLMHLWSLAVEWQFYIIFALILTPIKKNVKIILIVISSLLAISFFMNIFYTNTDIIYSYYSSTTRIWEFLMGAIASVVDVGFFSKLNLWLKCANITKRLLFKLDVNHNKFCSLLKTTTSAIGLTLIFVSFYMLNETSSFPGWLAVYPTIGAVMVILSGSRNVINKMALSTPTLVYMGVISYPLYLWHWPVLSFYRIIFNNDPHSYVILLLIFLSTILAILTHEFIEKPIKYGAVNTLIMLIFAMATLVGFSHYIIIKDGLASRTTIEKTLVNRTASSRPTRKNDLCKNYIGGNNDYSYCMYYDAQATETVAIIGDSHAHSAYLGLSEKFALRKKNTLLLANGGCPPLLGTQYGKSEEDKESCRQRIDNLLKVVTTKTDIKRIFLFTRGALYITGKYLVDGEKFNFKTPPIGEDVFFNGMNETIKLLKASGKSVIYVSENPELDTHPEECVDRPLRVNIKTCDVSVKVVKIRQEKYLKILSEIKFDALINVLDAFCNENYCKAFDNGYLLYADSDHLSIAGSRFQANFIESKGYLDDF